MKDFSFESNKYLRKCTSTKIRSEVQFEATYSFKIDTEEGLDRLNEILSYIQYVNSKKILEKCIPFNILQFNFRHEIFIHRIHYPTRLRVLYDEHTAEVTFRQWNPRY